METSVYNRSDFEQLARCVHSIGSPDFARDISQLCMSMGNAGIVYLCAFFDDALPVELYSSRSDAIAKNMLNTYHQTAYLLDPFYALFLQKHPDCVFHLDDIAPDDFRKSEYFHKFYVDLNVADEVGVLIYVGDSAALFFSFGNDTPHAQTVTTRLRTVLPLLSELVRRHWAALSPEQTDGSGRIATHLNSAFLAFGKSILTERECEIMRLILKGHSSKAIAREFNNSPETIKAHRKRIYSKLGIGAQGELISIFLDSLSRTPMNFDGDPLENYHTDKAWNDSFGDEAK